MFKKRNVKTRAEGRAHKKGEFSVGNTASKNNRGRKGLPGVDSQSRFSKAIDKFLIDGYIRTNSHSTPKELEAKLESENITVFEGMVIATLLRAYHTGDKDILDFFLDRTIGKVATKLEVKNTEDKFKDVPIEKLIGMKNELEGSNRHTLQLIEAEYSVIEPKQLEESSNGEVNGETAPQS